ncbi:MAG TPA: hypothetical protein VFD43_00915, partial [Planctomycetota bacterium]|nr:hypothetical protein [Planctomycetota bacterium]
MSRRPSGWLAVALGAPVLVAAATAATAAAAQDRLLPEGFESQAGAPHLAALEDGTVAAAFAVDDEVWCAVSQDGGKSFAAPARAGSSGKLERGLARGPR